MVHQIHTTMTARGWATLIVLSLVWGGSFFFVEIAVAALAPLSIVAVRVMLAALALATLMALRGTPFPRGARLWGALAVMGLLNNAVPFTLIVWAQTAIGSGLAAIFNATTPLFAVLVAALVLPDERPGWLRIAGVAAGFAGVAVMMARPERAGGDLAAQAAVLGAAFSYACAGAWGRRFARDGVPPVVAAFGQLAASSLLLVPLALVLDRSAGALLAAPGTVWASLLPLALLSTAFAYLLYFRLLAASGATNLLLVTFLVPVSAIWLGVAVLGETVTPPQLAGMALIGLGLAAIDGRLFDRLGRTAGS